MFGLHKQSLHTRFDLVYLQNQKNASIVRHHVSLEGRRQSWQDSALILPGTDPSTHTLEGHLLYLNALVSKGATIRDLIGDTLRFQYVTRASAGTVAAEALTGWLDATWNALLDMVAHRQRLRSFRSPDDIFEWVWEEHANVWLHFKWEHLVPSDGAMATAVLGQIRLYAFPDFSWSRGPKLRTFLDRWDRRIRAPPTNNIETVLVNLSGLANQAINRRSQAKLTEAVTFCRPKTPEEGKEERNDEPDGAQQPADPLLAPPVTLAKSAPEPMLPPGDASTPPTSAHQLWPKEAAATMPPSIPAAAAAAAAVEAEAHHQHHRLPPFSPPLLPPPQVPAAPFPATGQADFGLSWPPAPSWTGGWCGQQGRPLPPPPPPPPSFGAGYSTPADPYLAAQHGYSQVANPLGLEPQCVLHEYDTVEKRPTEMEAMSGAACPTAETGAIRKVFLEKRQEEQKGSGDGLGKRNGKEAKGGGLLSRLRPTRRRRRDESHSGEMTEQFRSTLATAPTSTPPPRSRRLTTFGQQQEAPAASPGPQDRRAGAAQGRHEGDDGVGKDDRNMVLIVLCCGSS